MPSWCISQSGDSARRCSTDFDDEVDHVVDLLLGVEPAEAEADRRVRELVADAERAEHVARLERRRRARRAGRHRDVLERHQQRLALDERERDVEVARQRRSGSSEPLTYVSVSFARDAAVEPVAQRARGAIASARHLFLRELGRLAEADDQRDRSACPSACRARDRRRR